MSSKEGTLPCGQYQDLPGFRFHPTDEELLGFYLRKAANRENLNIGIIPTLDLYRFNPWDLPEKTNMEERELYFFVPRDRRQKSNGGRPNRTTEKGFWKATGSDRHIRSVKDPKRVIGLKKTLVFYQGRAPRGTKTDWIMNEYRLPDPAAVSAAEDIVLCKVYRKATSMKELEQRAAVAEQEKHAMAPVPAELVDREARQTEVESSSCSSVREVRPLMRRRAPELELQLPNTTLDWTLQDPFLMQMRSPWVEYWSPYANLLNF